MKIEIDISDIDFKAVKRYKDYSFIPFPVLNSVIRSVQEGTPVEKEKKNED